MALNFTGRLPRPAPPPPPPRRAPVFLMVCVGLATLLGLVVFVMAVRAPRPPAPARPAVPPPLIGVSDPPVEPVPAQTSPPPVQAKPAQAPPIPAAEPAAVTPPFKAAPSPAMVKARMLQALKRAPHATITLSVEDDAGAEAYGRKLADLFREAGWTVDVTSVFGSGPPTRGLSAALGDTDADDAVRDAFAAADFTLGSAPPSAGIVRTPELFVGTP